MTWDQLRPQLVQAAQQAGLIAGIAVVLGVGHLAVRAPLPFVAEPPPPDAASCAPDELPQVHAVDRISVAEVRELLGQPGVRIVDARSIPAFEAGHIPGAMSLPADQADLILGVQSVPIAPDDLVITYCDGGRCEVSESLGLMLKDRAGCRRVRVLDGGWAQWLSQKAPVENASTEATP